MHEWLSGSRRNNHRSNFVRCIATSLLPLWLHSQKQLRETHTHTHTRTHSVADKKHPRPRTLAQRRLTSFGRSLVVCLSVFVYAASLSFYLQPGADRLVGCVLVTVQVIAPLSARAAPVLMVLIFSHFYSKTIKSVFLTCNTLHRVLCSAPAWARMCCSAVVVAVFLSLFFCSILTKLKEVK